MVKTPIIVIGAGGHSKVVSEIISGSAWEIVAYVDEGSTAASFLKKSVFKTLEQAQSFNPEVGHAFVAIGSNDARSRWSNILLNNGYTIPHFIHPSASVSPDAELSQGVLVCAMAIIGHSAKIGNGSIINCGTIVDHDSIVGSFTHLSQGVVVGGGAQIGSNSLVGPGSIIEKLAVVPANVVLPSATVFATARQ